MANEQTQDWRQALINITEGIETELQKERADLNRVLISIGEAYVNDAGKNISATEVARAQTLAARIDGLVWCYQLTTGYLGGMFTIPTKLEPPAAKP